MKQPEKSLQFAVVNYLRAVAPQCVVFAIPNAARRRRGAHASNAVPGLLPGAPDLVIVAPGAQFFALELKTPNGRLSTAQQALRIRFLSMAVPWALIRSVDDVRTALAHWKIATREAA